MVPGSVAAKAPVVAGGFVEAIVYRPGLWLWGIVFDMVVKLEEEEMYLYSNIHNNI